MRNTFFCVAVVVCVLAAGARSETVLFSDNFDSDTSAAWNILTSSDDTSVMFGFDYSTIGVPASPNGGGSTTGLRMAANLFDPASVEGVTLTPMGMNFSGNYQLKFDMWINANGGFPGGGGGSTEFLTAGIGHDNTTLNLSGTSGAGGWFATDGEGGSGSDYRGFKNEGMQYPASTQYIAGTHSSANNNSDPYYASFGGIDVAAAVPVQAALHPQQTGTTAVGTAGMAWHEVTITVNGATAVWAIDGLDIVALDPSIGATFALDGNISIGYMDIFTSVSDNQELSFGLIDNLVVTPEPTTMLLLAIGGIAVVRKRR